MYLQNLVPVLRSLEIKVQTGTEPEIKYFIIFRKKSSSTLLGSDILNRENWSRQVSEPR
jgi:hypothetical protein